MSTSNRNHPEPYAALTALVVVFVSLGGIATVAMFASESMMMARIAGVFAALALLVAGGVAVLAGWANRS
jgi:hypothetical protein